jgi:hypothetical protein
MGDPSVREGRDRNLIWAIFTQTGQRVVRDDDSQRLFEASVVADLRLASGRYPHDSSLQQLITALLAASPRFAAHGDNTEVREHHATRKTIDHPQVGRLTLDCDVLTVQGSDLRVIAYTAPADSPDPQALDLVRVLGFQSA